MNAEMFTPQMIFMIITLVTVVLGILVNKNNLQRGFKEQIEKETSWKLNVSHEIKGLSESTDRIEKKVDEQNRVVTHIMESQAKIESRVSVVEKEQATMWKKFDLLKEEVRDVIGMIGALKI